MQVLDNQEIISTVPEIHHNLNTRGPINRALPLTEAGIQDHLFHL